MFCDWQQKNSIHLSGIVDPAWKSSGCNIWLPRSIFIWAPPRTRPYFQHLRECSKIFQPVIRMLILEIHNAVVAVPANVTSLGCHCPPNMFYAFGFFLDIIEGSLGGETSVLRTFRMSGKELVKERVSKERVSQGKS